jgi:hypothetical protein
VPEHRVRSKPFKGPLFPTARLQVHVSGGRRLFLWPLAMQLTVFPSPVAITPTTNQR